MNPIVEPLLTSARTLAEEAPDSGSLGFNIFVYSAVIMAIILIFAEIAKKGVRKDGVWQGTPARIAEHAYLFIQKLATSLMGPAGKIYGPFLFAVWTFILVSNFFGLIVPVTPTADWSLNLAMAFICLGYVQYEGMRTRGVFGHVKHFAGPELKGALVLISVMLLVMESVSECFKIFSLSIRLFANIHGGHQLTEGLDGLTAVPLGGFLFPLEVLECIIQAFIWVILTATYIALVTPHAHGDHHGDDHGESADHAAIESAPADPAVA